MTKPASNSNFRHLHIHFGIALGVLASGCGLQSESDDLETSSAEVTFAPGESTEKWVGALVKDGNKICTAGLPNFNAANFKDDRFPRDIDDEANIPHWVYTAAHCVDGPAANMSILLPNVCTNAKGQAVNCDATNTTKMALPFNTGNCFTTDHNNAGAKGDHALCLIRPADVCPTKLRGFAWGLPDFAANRFESGTVTVRGIRYSEANVPYFPSPGPANYPGFAPDPSGFNGVRHANDLVGKVWSDNRAGLATDRLIASVAKNRRLTPAGNAYEWTSEGSVDHADSGGNATTGSSTKVIVGANHTTTRQIYIYRPFDPAGAAPPFTPAQCHAAQRATPPGPQATLDRCKQMTTILDSHITVIWGNAAQQIVAGTWAGVAGAADPADVLPSWRRKGILDPGEPVTELYEIATADCLEEPPVEEPPVEEPPVEEPPAEEPPAGDAEIEHVETKVTTE